MASGFPSAHQRKLGPAPFASFEDLSDEHENGVDGGASAQVVRMPGIIEVTTPVTSATLKTPSTPRIDISRASSSSHHEEDSNSHESTPEKELLAGVPPPEGCTLQLGYKEDVNDLRSSTEELDLQDPIHAQDLKREAKRARRRAKDLHDGTQSEHGISIKVSGERERKDSNCSEIILLNISGRTSRLSSVGSQGSGVSGGLSVSAASSRSPSPHKCLLETSFCGSVSTLASTLNEPYKPETDDLARLLLQREEDSTRAMIPDSVRVPVVGGNIKPDQLDMPRRLGREERKEIFKREVEITKKVLKRVNIEVPIIKLPKEPNDDDESSMQKPASLDLQIDRRNRSPSTSSRGLETPKQTPSRQKVRDLEGSRTPSPSSVSRKSSFTSLFKGRGGGGGGDTSIQTQQESPTTSSRRTSLASRLKDTAEILRSRSKSRDRGDKSPGARRSSRGSGVFSSTLSLFKKRERKKSGSSIGTPDTLDRSRENLDGIGHDYSYSLQSYYSQQQTPSRKKEGDVIFISLYGDNDEFRYKDETSTDSAMPSEIAPIPTPFESESQQQQQPQQVDEYDASSPQQTSANIVCTDATIEHHRRSRISDRSSKDSARISSSSNESPKIPESRSRDSHISKSESRDSRVDDRHDVGQIPSSEELTHRLSTSSSRDSIGRKPDIPKPKRKKKPTTRPPPPPTDFPTTKPELNGKIPVAPSPAIEQQHDSSESERDSEVDFVKGKPVEKEVVEDVPDERKGLCYEESFEEDLPYVPTTLPLEKSVAVPILPIKQRVIQEVSKTTPIERPRSTTPINPTLLDEFVHTSSSSHDEHQRRVDKMRISLPRDSDKVKSPHRPLTAQHSFSEFAGRVPRLNRALSLTKSPSPPPPLPPRAPTTVLTTVATRPQNWINFEEIPEKRKAPKRIQTIPRLEGEPGHSQTGAATATGQYSYVQPEECRCECHEESRRASLHGPRQSSSTSSTAGNGVCNGENCQQARAAAVTTTTSETTTETTGDRSSVVRRTPPSNLTTARRNVASTANTRRTDARDRTADHSRWTST